MEHWFRYFFGTPQRFMRSAVVIGLIVVMLFPGLLRTAVERLMGEIGPALGPIFSIIIVLMALRIIGRGFWK